MTYRRLAFATAAVLAGGLAAIPAVSATAQSASAQSHSVPGLPGLPAGVPQAAVTAEPTLPKPAGWPFPEAFPRTSGTGRLDDGASYWSDFVYDANGAMGGAFGSSASNLAPPRGTYTYPAGPADGDGADIFRAAVGADSEATYWRVDWNTLADPNVPIAEWAFDRDNNPVTGTSNWPAAAGVTSAGIDEALVVSGHGAWLVNPTSGQRTDVQTIGGALTIDRNAMSFVVRIPRTALPVDGTWRIRLAAGLATSAGTAFAPPSGQVRPGQPSVYNVTFRSYRQEAELVCPPGMTPPPMSSHQEVAECGNFWMENDQAQTLANNDVSKYSLAVNWSALESQTSTPELLPTGYSNRWYVSRLHLGQGVVPNDQNSQQGDLKPNFLGRIQPYAVYVPTHYRAGTPAPLTWILHSLGVNHNQYGALAPSEIYEVCEQRNSICATTLGYGPDGWYFDEAEVDFWQVWHALAKTYTLDPDSTVITGYSMGGFASYKLGLEYPDLFAAAEPLEGPPTCGLEIVNGIGGNNAGPGHCATDGSTYPLIDNARWIPYYISAGAIDELVPISSMLQQIQRFDDLGYRYRAAIYPLEDHLVFSTQNDFSPLDTAIGHPRRVVDPGQFTFTWYPDLVRADFGIGPTGAYWIRDLTARDHSPGKLARVDATAQALPDAPVTVNRSVDVAPADPTPAVLRILNWQLGRPATSQCGVSLTLHDVATLSIDAARARAECGTLVVASDGASQLRVFNLTPGTRVGNTTANSDGVAVLALHDGTSKFAIQRGSNRPAAAQPRAHGSLPRTGGTSLAVGALACVIAALTLIGRRSAVR